MEVIIKYFSMEDCPPKTTSIVELCFYQAVEIVFSNNYTYNRRIAQSPRVALGFFLITTEQEVHAKTRTLLGMLALFLGTFERKLRAFKL